MNRRVLVGLLVLVPVLGGSSGCAADRSPGESTPPPTQGGQSASTDSVSGGRVDGAVSVVVEYPAGDMSVQVHPVEAADGYSVLTVDFSLSEDAEGLVYLGQILSDENSGLNAGGIRLVSLGAEAVWNPGYTAQGRSASSATSLGLAPGDVEQVVTFYGPVAEPAVDVMIPAVGIVEHVPVVIDNGSAVTPESLDLGTDISFPDAAPIESYVQAYDESGAVSSVADEQTVTLASDVLFATDEFELTAQALSVVDAAGAAIAEVAGSGRVQVIGHTDDVGGDAYNLDLSQKRASSVAARLSQVLGSDFEIVTEGRGESDPAVPDTSAQARAANRRVEIRFSATSAPELAAASVPAATTPVSTRHQVVQYTAGRDEYATMVDGVTRHEGYLTARLTVTRVAGQPQISQLAGDVLGHMSPTQNIHGLFRTITAWSLRVAGESGWVYPAQSIVERPDGDGYIRPLADRNTVNIEPGDSLDFVVIWPDTDPSADAITIEAPEVFRITDIPVEES